MKAIPVEARASDQPHDTRSSMVMSRRRTPWILTHEGENLPVPAL
jgi:hypothetical protein